MRRSNLVLTILIVHLLASLSCGRYSQDTRRSANSNLKSDATTTGKDQDGYLMGSDSSILFVQWTKVGVSLNGQLQMFSIQGERQKTYTTSTHAFTGVNDVGKISINFTGSVWTDSLVGKTWTGSLQNDELTLVAPSKDGTLVPLKFKEATVEDYNQSVVALRNQAQRTNQEVQKQQEATAQLEAQQRTINEQQQAVADGNQRVANLIASLQNQTKGLYDAAKVDEVLPQVQEKLAANAVNSGEIEKHRCGDTTYFRQAARG